jgi:hypothetical protein
MSSGNGRRIHFGDCRAGRLVKTARYFLVLCPLLSLAAGYFSRYADFFVDRFALLGWAAPQHREEIFRNAAIPASEGGRYSCGFGLHIGAAGAQRELDRKIRRGS